MIEAGRFHIMLYLSAGLYSADKYFDHAKCINLLYYKMKCYGENVLNDNSYFYLLLDKLDEQKDAFNIQ